jgi:hypothetical protein
MLRGGQISVISHHILTADMNYAPQLRKPQVHKLLTESRSVTISSETETIPLTRVPGPPQNNRS